MDVDRRGRRAAGRAFWRAVVIVGLTIAACGLMPAVSSATTGSAGISENLTVTGTGAPPGIVKGADAVTLLAQPAWLVAPSGVFRLRLLVSAHDPAAEQIRVNVYARLTTRTGFDDALTGQLGQAVIYPLGLDLSKLPRDPAGGVDVDIPINRPATSLNIPTFYAAAGSGVFPIQIGIYDTSGDLQGQPLTTYLVYAEPYPASGLPKLSVSLVLPVHSAPTVDQKGQIGPLPPDQSRALADLVGGLSRHLDVRLSLAVTPQTLDSLAAGSALDRSTLTELAQLVESGHIQILPSTYVSVPMRGWNQVGLGGELNRQLNSGSSILGAVFGTAPSPRTWVVNGPIDTAALNNLVGRGAAHFILPDAELSALPPVARTTTFALPAELLGTDANPSVYSADSGLTADFSNRGGAVLAADQLLAELAMIQLETPGLTRGVAVLPPPGWSPNPTFVDTLLAGLVNHPLLNPVTASGLFSAVPVASVQRSVAVPVPPTGSSAPASSPGSEGSSSQGSASGGSGSTGSTSSTSTTIAPGLLADVAAQLGADADAIRSARERLSGLDAILPQSPEQAQLLDRDLLTSESSDVTEGQRQSLLGEVFTASNRVTRLISLPRASSITLTSTKGEVPLTVLSVPSLRARVQLRLSSQRLIFHLSFPPGGKCRIPTPTSEVCDLTLTTQNTTLKVPVEARASGVFPIDVSLWTPDGSQMLARNRDTVRSTAVSGVGIILIAVAVVSLAIWWGRDLRYGRRARRLVPAPGEEDEYGEADGSAEEFESGNGSAGEFGDQLTGSGAAGGSDRSVREFFSTPAPEYQQRPSEPRP
jgi:hypothetical protein